MSDYHEFCDHCPGCQPAIIDMTTGVALAPDHPTMMAIMRIWRSDTSYAQRKAFIDCTLHNSRDEHDLRLATQVMTKFGKILGVIT